MHENKIENNINKIGLLGGNLGSLLCNYYIKEESEEYITKQLEICLDIIPDKQTALSFCNGLAGVSWLFNFFNKKDIIDVDMDNMFGKTDEYLHKYMIQQVKTGNFDFLHGAVGIGIYFIDRLANKKIEGYIFDLIDGLFAISIQEKDGSFKIISVVNHETGEKGYNLSLSHGFSSIIVFLSKAIDQNINIEKSNVLLNGSVKYLLKNKLSTTNNFHSVFPSVIADGIPLNSSRLAWCYGDLGIGIALYQAGVITKKIEWEEFALDVLYKCTKRRNLKQNSVVDAGLCHGTAGIGQIFHRMYRNTDDAVFKDAAQYWFDKTRKFEKSEQGYKAWQGKLGWVNETNLLEGATGIKLALHCWENNIDPDWDSCLLLS